MSIGNCEVKKVCQFLSTFLTRSQNDPNFCGMKDALYKLLNSLIEFDEFFILFPVNLPNQCLQVIKKHLYLLREQYSMGLLKIAFIQNSNDVQMKPVEENKKLVQQIYESPHRIKIINSSNNKIPGVIIKPITISGNQTPIQRKGSIRIQNISTPISVVKADNIDKTKAEPLAPLITAKKKKIDISNHSGVYDELKVFKCIRAYDDLKGNRSIGRQVESISMFSEEPMKFAVKEMIEKFVEIGNVDYANIVPYVEDCVNMFAEILLVHAAYYSIHREKCKTEFQDGNMYKQIDDNRAFYGGLRKNDEWEIANKEREEKEKEYHSQGKLEDRRKQRENFKLMLSNKEIQKANDVINDAFKSKRKELEESDKKPIERKPIICKKRITAKDFLSVLHQRVSLTRLKTYKSVVNAVNK